MTSTASHATKAAMTLLVLTLAAPSPAQTLEEIIVTAQSREQGLQDVPISVSAVTGEQITSAAIQKAEDIQFLVPNFTLTETGIATNIFIRGIGSGINQGFEQSVGTYIDGIHYGRAQQFRSPFLDLARVEVLRGPQSILFGKNSVAGAMNITTAKPTDEFEGRVFGAAEFEDQETIFEGMVSGPLSDRVRGRLAGRTRNADGYFRNNTLNRDEPEREDWTLRGMLEFDVTPDLLATVKAEVGEFDVTGRHIEIINEQPAVAGPFAPLGSTYNQILSGTPPLGFGQDASVTNVTQDAQRSSNGDFSNNETSTYAVTLDWALGEFELKSVSAYTGFEYDELCDCDFTGATVFNAALQEEYTQFSQEFRLTSPIADAYDYILGFYYQRSDHEYADQVIFPANSVAVPALNALSPGAGTLLGGTQADRQAVVDNEVFSGFAQFNWNVSDVFTLQLGGRLTNDTRDGFRGLSITSVGGAALPAAQVGAPLVWAGVLSITSTNLASLGPTGAGLISALGGLPVSGTRDETKFSPDVKLVWDVNNDTLLYGSWAQGFKSGSFDFRANNRSFFPTMAASFEFEDEEATNFELGGKFTLAGGAVELNATAFFTEYDDLQISIFDGGLGFNVGNAASAEILGFEVDGRWAVNNYLMITGGFAVTDFEFTNFRNGQCYFGQTPDVDLDGDMMNELCDYTGKSNQMVSDFQGNLAFDINYPLGDNYELDTVINVFYTSEYDASATFDPALVQGGYSKINLRLALVPTDRNWEVALLAKNLTDEEVLQFGGDTPLAGSFFGAKSNYAFYSQGRTVTLQGSYSF